MTPFLITEVKLPPPVPAVTVTLSMTCISVMCRFRSTASSARDSGYTTHFQCRTAASLVISCGSVPGPHPQLTSTVALTRLQSAAAYGLHLGKKPSDTTRAPFHVTLHACCVCILVKYLGATHECYKCNAVYLVRHSAG